MEFSVMSTEIRYKASYLLQDSYKKCGKVIIKFTTEKTLKARNGSCSEFGAAA